MFLIWGRNGGLWWARKEGEGGGGGGGVVGGEKGEKGVYEMRWGKWMGVSELEYKASIFSRHCRRWV